MYKISTVFVVALIFTIQGFELPRYSGQRLQLEDTNNVSTEDNSTINYRLPTNVKPISYRVTLTPYLQGERQFEFDGLMDIKLTVEEDVKNITLHAKKLTIMKLTLITESLKVISDIEFTLKEKTDFLIIKRDENAVINKGTYTLQIKYSGKLDNDMRGFYRSSYINDKKEQVWLATTHFEPVDARRAFPCFDEPALKAKFTIIINHDKKYTAFSNMPIEKEPKVVNDMVTTTFKETPPMSTYLIAFVVSDFKNVSHTASQNFTVAARPNAIQHNKLALESGLKLLKALEKFIGVNYTMGKMDQIAIPDFSAGAMENWGLVLYREKSLLFDEKTSTTNEKKNIVETIAHEFAHQWFGNLVSPKWWKYIWLNEGFANFFQSYITDKVEPEWRSVEQAVIKSIQTTSFDVDCESETHPINHEVKSPEEIRALFDTISYSKGGAVIRMMQHFLSEEIFLKGLKHYLVKMTNKVADSDDLFNAIQEVVKESKINLKVPDIMKSWVDSKGYPVVKVVRSADNKSFEITQQRFYTYEPSEEEKKNEPKWKIPINYATLNNLNFNDTSAQYWLTNSSGKLPISAENDGFIILNKQHTGYYRVQYDNQTWNLITTFLNSGNHSKIHVLNRAQLINDALAFAKQKKLDLPILLNLINYLQNETDYIAWYPGFKAFSWLNSHLINTNTYSVFKKFAYKRMKPLIESVGLEVPATETDKEYLTKLNRITAIDWACTLNVQLNETACTTEMQKKVEAWLQDSDKNVISPDLKKVTLCGGLRKAAFEVWEKAFNRSISTNPDEKKELLHALACSSDKTILENYFNHAIKENSPLENDTITIIQHIYQNSEIGVDVALDLIINRLSGILMKNSIDNVAPVLLGVSKKVTTDAQLEKLKMAQKSDIPEHVINPAVEAAQKNIDWLKENEAIIKSAIDKLDNNGVNIFSVSVSLIALALASIFAAS